MVDHGVLMEHSFERKWDEKIGLLSGLNAGESSREHTDNRQVSTAITKDVLEVNGLADGRSIVMESTVPVFPEKERVGRIWRA